MQSKSFFKILLFLFIVTLAACSGNKKSKPNPNIPPKYAITEEPAFVKQGELSFVDDGVEKTKIDIELADTEAKHEQGLMHRRTMGQNQGMLFVFDKEERQSFWMKNVPIALDIIFVNEAKEIVHIAYDCTPYSTRSIPSYEYAKYVVEVNAGYCKKHQIKVGDFIVF